MLVLLTSTYVVLTTPPIIETVPIIGRRLKIRDLKQILDLKLNYLIVDNSYTFQLAFLSNILDYYSDLGITVEPYLYKGVFSIPNQFISCANNRITLIIKENLSFRLLLSQNNIIVITIENYLFIACYMSLNKPRVHHLDQMDQIIKILSSVCPHIYW